MLCKCCVKIKTEYIMYSMAIVFVGSVVVCSSNDLERGQMQIRQIDNLDTAQRYVLPHYTKEDSVYIPRVCSSTHCKSRTLSKHHHQPAHRYVSPVPSARLHAHEYKKEKNKRKPYQHAINPYFFQNPNLQTYDEIYFEKNYKRNKRATNVNSGDGNLSNNPAVQANIDTIFESANKQHNDDTLLNNPELQAIIENIFNPKPITLYTTDKKYDKSSNNVEQANIVPAMMFVTKEQNQRNTDQHASSKSYQYPNLQTAIVNLYGPPVLPLEDNKILETNYQYVDNENTGQEHRFRSVEFFIDKYEKSVSTESVRGIDASPRTTGEPQYYVETQKPTNNTELAPNILDVFGTPSISAGADFSDTTESSHKVNTTDLKSDNANDTGYDHRFRSSGTIQNSFDRMSSGSEQAQKNSFFMSLLCLLTFILFFM